MTLIAILISIVEYHDDTPVKNYEISSHEIEIDWLKNAMICGTSCPILYTYKNYRFILNMAV